MRVDFANHCLAIPFSKGVVMYCFVLEIKHHASILCIERACSFTKSLDSVKVQSSL